MKYQSIPARPRPPLWRIANTLQQIRASIPPARESIESDIVDANRDKAILGIANFLGSESGPVSKDRLWLELPERDDFTHCWSNPKLKFSLRKLVR